MRRHGVPLVGLRQGVHREAGPRRSRQHRPRGPEEGMRGLSLPLGRKCARADFLKARRKALCAEIQMCFFHADFLSDFFLVQCRGH